MPDPRQPDPDRDTPMPAPSWKPEPVRKPERHGLPDEVLRPNPDETDDPPAPVGRIRTE
ncbi:MULTISPECIES: hypothetical protein [unclassified Mesorhizobium]|uniref:hypothetical protein n=1 Tax=unclassified Mesorhizobium TaxID=325217 RepID=UPI002417CCAC|nr:MULTISPECIES: hypothetical protein [unclassified Mesorhizobium]MDG4902197.1 hypothetical protein [Mesorhizobium sp. WSM4962]MDG4919686.1 hypothetical protein [Mesorhizobium sp. WSM4989]